MKSKIRIKYDLVDHFYEGLARVRLNGKYGYINKQGQVVIPVIYDYVGYFLEGLVRVELNEKWGFISPQGQVIIPIIYDFANNFNKESTVVVFKGISGIISRTRYTS